MTALELTRELLTYSLLNSNLDLFSKTSLEVDLIHLGVCEEVAAGNHLALSEKELLGLYRLVCKVPEYR